MKTPSVILAIGLLGNCQSTDHGHDTPKPKAQEMPVGKHVKLGPGVYQTRGFILEPGGSLVGAGMDKTTIRLEGPSRLAINGWAAVESHGARVADLTIECGVVSSDTNFARCGIGGNRWVNGVVERVRVRGLGSFCPKLHERSESFGIILSGSSNSIIRDCIVEKNNGGYVSAFCISGVNVTGSNLTARFRYDGSWSRKIGVWGGALQAFTVSGGTSQNGSRNLAYLNCRTENAAYGVFGDSGVRVDGLVLSNITGSLKSYPWLPKQAVRLVAGPEYLNVRTNNVSLR
jgi:hypothetical protein